MPVNPLHHRISSQTFNPQPNLLKVKYKTQKSKKPKKIQKIQKKSKKSTKSRNPISPWGLPKILLLISLMILAPPADRTQNSGANTSWSPVFTPLDPVPTNPQPGPNNTGPQNPAQYPASCHQGNTTLPTSLPLQPGHNSRVKPANCRPGGQQARLPQGKALVEPPAGPSQQEVPHNGSFLSSNHYCQPHACIKQCIAPTTCQQPTKPGRSQPTNQQAGLPQGQALVEPPAGSNQQAAAAKASTSQPTCYLQPTPASRTQPSIQQAGLPQGKALVEPPAEPSQQGQWSPSIITNKQIKTIRGNIHLNKGSAYLQNRMLEIRQLVKDLKPHVLALSEAQVLQATNLEDLQLEDYNLHLDGIHEVGGTAREAVYTHKDLVVQPRRDLQHPNLTLVALQLGRPRQKKMTLLSFYCQWRELNLDTEATKVSKGVPAQASRFQQIVHIWDMAIQEGREVITLSDSNLSNNLLTDQDVLSDYDTKLKSIAAHYVSTIMNLEPTHCRPGGTPSTIDHITSTHPALINNVTTTVTGISNHTIISCICHTKAPVLQPHYRIKRDYHKIEPMEMGAKLLASTHIREATISQDPSQATQLLTQGIMGVLGELAPARRIQTQTNHAPFLSSSTRKLQWQRDQALAMANRTGHPEHFREYRNLRNLATTSLRRDHSKHMTSSLEDKGPRESWQTVRHLADNSPKGPPTLLTIAGNLTSSPKAIAKAMNEFYISKVTKIRQALPPSLIDPMEAMKCLLAGRNLKDTLTLYTVSRIKFRRIMRNMRPTCSPGTDGITMRLLRDYQHQLEPAIFNIVNLSISSGIFPEELKVSKVLPMLKGKEPPNLPNSYHPVNIVQSLGTIIESSIPPAC